ncbi:MAG: tail fiber domain-containing protein [Ferruginibacter sp.]
MKKNIAACMITCAFFWHTSIAQTGNVGIGTFLPQARLHVTDSSVLFSTEGFIPASAGNPPASGLGRRMMWYADKAAFRVGHTNGTYWDKDSIGNYSFASGNSTKAKGNYSTAMGWLSKAEGTAAFAAGQIASASGEISVALGQGTASGNYSTAMGFNTIASGDNSTAMGFISKAFGGYSTAIGTNAIALGENSTSMGYYTNANGAVSTTLGYYNIAKGFGSTVLGLFNDSILLNNEANFLDPLSPVFIIGNGVDNNNRKNAMTVLRNGKTGIGTSSPGQLLHIYGTSAAVVSKIENAGTGEAIMELKGGGAGSRDWMLSSEGSGSTIGAGNLNFKDNTLSFSRMLIDRNGNVGIGTTAPFARLHVTDSAVLFSAGGNINVTPGLPPLQGNGRRMMWYPDKAAFRTGYVSSTEWDKDSIGNYSFASGYNTKAKGIYSTAMGFGSAASGNFSTSIGLNGIASGTYSIAIGPEVIASGTRSLALGYQTISSGEVSSSIGYQTYASGDYSTSMGATTYAKSAYETVIGRFNSDYSPVSTTSWTPADRLFTIGNGTSFVSRSDAMTVLKNGNIGIGNNAPNAPLAFANTTGRKISLYDGGLNNYYGIGVESGQLQIYTDASPAKISFGYYNAGTFVERMYLSNSTGILTVNGTNYPSDARFKKEISILQNPLQKILAIKGVEYFMRSDEFPSKHFDTKLQVGLIAQDIEKVLPQAVQTDKEGFKSVDYAKVVPLLVEGMKEQQKQIDELKKLVEKLIHK